MAEGRSRKKKLKKPVKPSKTVVSPKARKKAGARRDDRRKAAAPGAVTGVARTPAAPAKKTAKSAAARKRVTTGAKKAGAGGNAGVRASTAPARGGQTAKTAKKTKKERGRKERVPLARRVREVSPRTVILVMLAAFFIAFAFGPTTRNLKATSKLKQKEAELTKEEEITRSLEQQVAEARSMEYIEQEARRQRLVVGGETLYIVTSDESGPSVEYRVKALQSMDEAWERVRLILNCQHSRNRQDDREGD